MIYDYQMGLKSWITIITTNSHVISN